MIPANASLHSYDTEAVSDATANPGGGPSLVQQQFGEEVDINTIVRRFGLTREMPSGVAGGVYGDFTGIQDYQDAVDRIERARAGFMTLAPEIRERFNNDPGELVSLAQSLPEGEFVALISADPEVPVVAEPAPGAPVAPVAPVVV